MITKEQITESLSPVIESQYGFIPPDQFGFAPTIVLARYEDGATQTISVDDFAERFKESENMNADSLLAIDKGEMGYETFINEWQELGYIK